MRVMLYAFGVCIMCVFIKELLLSLLFLETQTHNTHTRRCVLSHIHDPKFF